MNDQDKQKLRYALALLLMQLHHEGVDISGPMMDFCESIQKEATEDLLQGGKKTIEDLMVEDERTTEQYVMEAVALVL